MSARIIETSDIVNNGTVKFGTTVELLKTEENLSIIKWLKDKLKNEFNFSFFRAC